MLLGRKKLISNLVEAGHGDGDMCLVRRPVEIDRSGYHVAQHARCAQEATQVYSSTSSSSAAIRHGRPDAPARCSFSHTGR